MARQWNRCVLCSLASAFLATACLTPEHNTPPPTESCSAGLLFCSGNISKACGDDGTVVSSVACATTQTCIQGECQDNHVCQPDQALCVRNRLETCNASGTGLASKDDCGDDVCTNGACVAVTGLCPPLAAVCVGNSTALCGLDGSSYLADPVPCGDAALCVEGQCLSFVCDPGAATCDGDVARTCNIWGTGYSVEETCSTSQPCVRGRCQVRVCAPGAHCVEQRLITCSEDGTVIVDDRTCGQGRSCVVDHCEAVASDAGTLDRTGTDTRRTDGSRPDTAVGTDTRRSDAARPDANVGDAAPAYCETHDDSYEPNDLRGQAKSIGNAVTVSSLVACDDDDWFSTSVPSNQALTVKADFTETECDLDLYVYAPGQNEALVGATSANAPEQVVYDGPSGSVLIRVFNYSWPRQYCSYTLTTALRALPVCGDTEVEGSELCDTGITSGNTGACPTSCTDSGCNDYRLEGAGSCHARCVAYPVSSCLASDSCCPERCTALNDNDCPSDLLPCSSDSSCSADHYCDLDRAVPACKVGCRINVASTCDSSHHCVSDHRCVLNSVSPHGRCSSCSEQNPCNANFTCDIFGQCAANCFILVDDRCVDLVNANSTCLIQWCSQDDCP